MVSDDSRECVIIDCGAFYDEEYVAIDNYLRKQQLKPVHLLATHGHLDHNFGNAHLFQQYGLKVEICAEDQQLVERLPQQAAALFGIEISDDQPPGYSEHLATVTARVCSILKRKVWCSLATRCFA